MSDTEVSELGNEDRDTLPPKPLEVQLSELQGALGEANALSILSRDASAKCADLCGQLLSRLAEGDRRFAKIEHNQARILRRLGMVSE